MLIRFKDPMGRARCSSPTTNLNPFTGFFTHHNFMAEQQSTELKNLGINKLLLFIAVVTLAGGISTTCIAWAKGWLGVPDKITALEQSNIRLVTLAPRVDNLEKAQAELFKKESDSHDLLLSIDQSLKDVKEQNTDLKEELRAGTMSRRVETPQK